MSAGVSFAGDGEKDVRNTANSTSAPNVGQGGSKGLDFAGNGAADVTHSMESTRAPNAQMPSGKGELVSPTDTGYRKS